MRSVSELVASISWSTATRARDSPLLRKFQLGNSWHSSEIPFGQGILQMHLRVEITRNCHASWVQVQIPKEWWVIDIRLTSRLDFFSLLLKSKVKVLIEIVLRSHYSQFLLFSESPTSSAIPDGVAQFLALLCNSSGSSRACWRSKTFPGILVFSRVFRGIPTSRVGFLELEVIRAWWGT